MGVRVRARMDSTDTVNQEVEKCQYLISQRHNVDYLERQRTRFYNVGLKLSIQIAYVIITYLRSSYSYIVNKIPIVRNVRYVIYFPIAVGIKDCDHFSIFHDVMPAVFLCTHVC